MIPIASTLLLVEDDPYDAKLIRRALQNQNVSCGVQLVQDGEAAIAYLSGASPYEDRLVHPLPALVLLDLKIPRRNGFEVLEWIRGCQVIRRLPVVVLTSSQEHNDVNRAYDLGANSYLVKPLSASALSDLLKAVEQYWLVTNTAPRIEP